MAFTYRIFVAVVLASLKLPDVANAQPKVTIPGLGIVVGETYRFYREEYPTVDKDIDRFCPPPPLPPPPIMAVYTSSESFSIYMGNTESPADRWLLTHTVIIKLINTSN